MANLIKATALIFDSSMLRILLIKGPKLYAPFIDMHETESVRDVLAMAMARILGIPKESQPQWWIFRIEDIHYDSESSISNHFFFGCLNDHEFNGLASDNSNFEIAPILIVFKGVKVSAQLSYLVPMARFLAKIEHHCWPKP